MLEANLRLALTDGLPVLSVSDSIEALLGFSPDSFVSARVSLKDRIHPHDADIAFALFSAQIETQSTAVNLRIRHADGRIRCMKASYLKAVAPGGEAVILDLLLQDAKSLRQQLGQQALMTNFRAMMENSEDHLCFKDRNHVFTGASQTMVALTSSARHWTDLLGKTDYDLLEEDLADVYYRLEKQVFAGARAACEIQETVTRDGRKGWVDNRKYPILDEAGAIVGLWGIARDITARKLAEAALQDREAGLATAQARAHLGSWELDLTTMTGNWSVETSRLHHRDPSPNMLSFGEFLELLHPEDRARCQEAIGKIEESSGPLEFEYRTNPSFGPTRQLSVTAYMMRDAVGNPLRIEGTTLDITERKQAEAALRESEESLRESQKIAGLGSYVLDIPSGAWTSSDVLDQVLGIDKHYEHSVAGWAAFMHPEDRAMMAAYLADGVIGQGKPFDKEYRIARQSDGAERWVHGLGQLEFDAQGLPSKMHGTIQDITERKLADAALRESKELLQLFIEHAPAALAMYDREMRILSVSRRWRENFSQTGRDVTGHSAYEILPDIPERWKEVHRRGLAGHSTRKDEDRFDRADGTALWLRWEVRPWLQGDGSVGGIIIFSEDITEQKKADAALRESRELLRLFIEHAPAALAMFDREMRYLAASQHWFESYSLVGKEILGQFHYDIFPDIPERWREAHRRGLAGETLRADDDRFERADGRVQWIKWEVRPWLTGDGAVGGIVLFAEDVTSHKQAEERLQLAASVFTHAREGIFIADVDGNILEVNDTFTRITGYTREEVLGKNPRLLSSGFHGKEFYAEMWRTIKEKGQWSGEVWNRHKNGEIFAEMLTINALFDSNGDPRQYVALFSDITALKEHERKLQHIAHYDILTGLPNRVLLADRLHQAMAHAHRRDQALAVAFLDLDGFKTVNDRHGHSVGDQLLTSLASRMKLALREGDTLARLGGDEFVAVLLDVGGVDTSVQVLGRLLEAAAEPVLAGGLALQVSASVGVTFYPQPEDVDADQLLRQADQAMYQAKLAGRNRYHIFDSSQDRSVRGHHEDIALIRKALAAREFVLYYQPMVNMRTGAVEGAEALIRWQHPERGLLPPAMFLPIIEDHPLAVDVGEWVIGSALTQLELWSASGLEIPISVNVGALQLQQADFVDRLRTLLAAHPSVKPPSLELEVLETSALQDVAQVSRVIGACNELGVTFALDDFGTGYSSLTYLKRLPAKILKIDQSFVRGILDDAEDLTIIEGVLGLASAFRRQVIAEGVETVEHGLILLQLGCELAQGYGIAHPMPAQNFPAWAASWKPDASWTSATMVSSSDRPLLYAGVEHQAWIAATDAFLKGERRAAPPLDAHDCRFGSWLDEGGLEGRGSLPALQAVSLLHQELHALAEELCNLHIQGRNPEALVRLDELHGLRDELLEHLKGFRQQA